MTAFGDAKGLAQRPNLGREADIELNCDHGLISPESKIRNRFAL